MSESAIRFIEPPEPNDRIIAYEIDGHFKADDMRAFLTRMEKVTSQGKKALLYQDIESYEGVDIAAVGEKLKNMGKIWKGIEKVAVIGDSRWLQLYINAVDHITPQQIKHFPTTEKDAAWAWLTEEAEGSASEA
jgi:hypothetical protein